MTRVALSFLCHVAFWGGFCWGLLNIGAPK